LVMLVKFSFEIVFFFSKKKEKIGLGLIDE
jgi:hypothetical protein